MITAKIIDTKNGKVYVHSGDFAINITGASGKETEVILLGQANSLDLAERVGICIARLFRSISSKEEKPEAEARELIMKTIFLKGLFESKENAPEGQE